MPTDLWKKRKRPNLRTLLPQHLCQVRAPTDLGADPYRPLERRLQVPDRLAHPFALFSRAASICLLVFSHGPVSFFCLARSVGFASHIVSASGMALINRTIKSGIVALAFSFPPCIPLKPPFEPGDSRAQDGLHALQPSETAQGFGESLHWIVTQVIEQRHGHI